MIASGVGILIGGDDGTFAPHLAEARRRGYQVVRDQEELRASSDDPVLGLFPQRSTPLSYGPRLEVTTAFALNRLEADDRPFVLMIEQEETDNAGHSNDSLRVADGMMEFDDAVRTALEFARRRDDTLVIVTADHDTGGMGETDKGRIDWLGVFHTGQWVPILADGPGADAFSGVYESIEVPRRIARLLGLKDFPSVD
jgi:alkaline phosphatase